MPKRNALDKSLSNIHKVADNAPAITVFLGLVSTATMTIVKMMREKEKKIDISAICDKKYKMTISEALEYLEKNKVEAMAVPMKISEAHPKYRNGFEFQVVDVTPSCKITPGTIPQLHYLTVEVINRSQELYDSVEQPRKLIRNSEIR